MANEEDRKLPAGMAGITTYTDVKPEKVKLKPEYVIAVIVVSILAEVVLYLSVPI